MSRSNRWTLDPDTGILRKNGAGVSCCQARTTQYYCSTQYCPLLQVKDGKARQMCRPRAAAMLLSPPAKALTIRVTVTDLWRDPEGGWSENASVVHRYELLVDDSMSEQKICRLIKQAAYIQGWKKDTWCSSDYGPWRSGCMGAYADIVEE